MQFFNSKLLSRLLCLLLALCMVTCCFAGCDNASNDRDDEDEDEEEEEQSKKDDARKGLEEYELNGLTYYLSDDFEEKSTDDSDYKNFVNDDDTIIEVTCGPMDGEASSSKEFAQLYVDMVSDINDSVVSDSANGVHYTTIEITDNVFQICGYYVQDDYGWIISATVEDEDLVEDMVNLVTLGEIDKDFDPDDYAASDDDDNDYEYEDNYVEDDYEVDVPTTSDTFTVHAYVPDSWGSPACWAWSNTTGENVFDAWPGEYMTWEEGYYYTIEIPSWAEYVIVNGNDGGIQTGDEAVEPGSDIWIVIAATGDSYGVHFEEPDAALLSEYGY